MKKLLLYLVLALVLLGSAAALADGDFYVVGGRPSVGTRITSLPYEIKTSGYYYLGGNLSYAGGNGITVLADNVTIDLMGFALTGPSSGSFIFSAIYLNGRHNVEVRNGTVSGWYMGFSEYGDGGSHHRVIGVRAAGNQHGIYMRGNDHLIQGCLASPSSFVMGTGLYIKGNGAIRGCTVMNFGYNGIAIGGGTVSGNVVLDCIGASSIGIAANGSTTINHNQVSYCTTGIFGSGGGSIIGNNVYTTSGQTGIELMTNTGTPNVLDQNNVSGAGTHYGPGSAATIWGINGGR